jgi:hypothetical protein
MMGAAFWAILFARKKRGCQSRQPAASTRTLI